MDVAALIISFLALLAAGVAALHARTTARETQRQADAAAGQIHLAYTPRLEVTLKQCDITETDLLYEIRNLGPKDLDSVLVERPSPATRCGIRSRGWDPTSMIKPNSVQWHWVNRKGSFSALDPVPNSPEFRVRITSRAGNEDGPQSHLLEPRRTPQIW